MPHRPHRLLPLPYALVALLVACEPVTAPSFPGERPPEALVVRVAGFGFGSHVVTLRGDTLVVERRLDWRPDSARITRVVPTPAEWAAFWRAADAAGVRAWPRRCVNDRVADGGGYSLDITYPGGQVVSTGTNAYPRRDGGCSEIGTTDEYRAFTAAVSALVGLSFP